MIFPEYVISHQQLLFKQNHLESKTFAQRRKNLTGLISLTETYDRFESARAFTRWCLYLQREN